MCRFVRIIKQQQFIQCFVEFLVLLPELLFNFFVCVYGAVAVNIKPSLLRRRRRTKLFCRRNIYPLSTHDEKVLNTKTEPQGKIQNSSFECAMQSSLWAFDFSFIFTTMMKFEKAKIRWGRINQAAAAMNKLRNSTIQLRWHNKTLIAEKIDLMARTLGIAGSALGY